MNIDQRKIDSSLQRLSKLGIFLYWITLIFTFLFALVLILSITYAVKKSLAGEFFDESNSILVFMPAIWSLTAFIGCLIVSNITKDVSRGHSPFTLKHARQIKVLSLLFLIIAVLELIFSSGFISITIGSLTIYSSTLPVFDSPSFPIDIFAFVASIAIYSLSIVWKYGSILQLQSDETV